MLPFLNPLPIILIFATLFGVAFHDTQFDKAATSSLAAPVSVSDYGSIETALRMNDGLHTSTERTSVATNLPIQQPRLLEDKKYIIQKRLATNDSNSDYHWPILA
jgi:hypothetical protein